MMLIEVINMDINKALVEVQEVLKYLVEDEKIKIPEEMWDFIEKNKDNQYIWNIDKSKKLQEQNMSKGGTL